MVSAKPSKKCAERIRKCSWKDERKDPAGNPLSIHEHPSTSFDSFLLLGMLLAIAGFYLRSKFACWTSLIFPLHCLGHYRGREDFRQLMTSFIVSISSLSMMYMKNSDPMEW